MVGKTPEAVVPVSDATGLFELIYEVEAEDEAAAEAEVAVLIADQTSEQEELLEEDIEEYLALLRQHRDPPRKLKH
jgi:hypothetical protein